VQPIRRFQQKLYNYQYVKAASMHDTVGRSTHDMMTMIRMQTATLDTTAEFQKDTQSQM
jgi:hypothetical protein